MKRMLDPYTASPVSIYYKNARAQRSHIIGVLHIIVFPSHDISTLKYYLMSNITNI